jgi:hypothetical protein
MSNNNNNKRKATAWLYSTQEDDGSKCQHTDKKKKVDYVQQWRLLFKAVWEDDEQTQIIHQLLYSPQWNPCDVLFRFRTRMRELIQQLGIDPLKLIDESQGLAWQQAVCDDFPWKEQGFADEVNNWGRILFVDFPLNRMAAISRERARGNKEIFDHLFSRMTDKDSHQYFETLATSLRHFNCGLRQSTVMTIVKCLLAIRFMREPNIFAAGYQGQDCKDFFTDCQRWWKPNYVLPLHRSLAIRRIHQALHVRKQCVFLINTLQQYQLSRSLIYLVAQYYSVHGVEEEKDEETRQHDANANINHRSRDIAVLTVSEHAHILRTCFTLNPLQAGQKELPLVEAQEIAHHPDVIKIDLLNRQQNLIRFGVENPFVHVEVESHV